ncbi:hypothetical protein BgiBS90_029538, partial [Biomphalaria glabrata]
MKSRGGTERKKECKKEKEERQQKEDIEELLWKREDRNTDKEKKVKGEKQRNGET